MKKILVLGSVLGTIAITAGVQASDLKGFRIGVNLNSVSGASKVSVPVAYLNENTVAAGGDVEKTSFGFSSRSALGLGATVGYDFHRNFGAVFSYLYSGSLPIIGGDGQAANVRGNLKAHVFSLSGEGRLPVAESLDLTARLGLSMIRNTLSVRQTQGSVINLFPDYNIRRVKETQWGVNYGVGAQYHINECTDLNLGVEAITPWNGRKIKKTQYNRVHAGVSYKF